MASNTAAVPPLYELSGALEELRRQLAAANDAQVASEVGQHNQTVLSNIMLTEQESGQVAPPEDLERGHGGAQAASITPLSNSQNGVDHNTSTDSQAVPPVSLLDQIPAEPDLAIHHNQTPFSGQILKPDVHLAQAAQLAATSQSQAEQFSRGEFQTTTTTVEANDPPVAVVPIADQTTDEDAGFSFTV